MNMRQEQTLRRELQTAGAGSAETDQLLPIAQNLHFLTSKASHEPQARRYISWRSLGKPVALSVTCLVLGMALVMTSQSVLPTSWLYPVQKLSDTVAVSLHPEYRATLMMKRAEQVNQLVAARARSTTILMTLNDYTAQASTYEASANANYAAFTYCKTNLQQASTQADPVVRRAIQSSLQSLETS